MAWCKVVPWLVGVCMGESVHFLEVLSLIFCNFFVVCGLPVYHERCSSKHVEKREDKITQGQ